MKIYKEIKQGSPEWDALRVASIGGTRFGQVISGKKNRLVYTLANEKLNGYIDEDDFVSDAMQFGIDNEPVARQLYSQQSGIEWQEVGLLKSDDCEIHHASPDGISPDASEVLEIKCTTNGDIHIERFFSGPETSHLPQIKNYFAISDQVKRVHWVSYCPFRPEKPLVVHVFVRGMFVAEIPKWRAAVKRVEVELERVVNEFSF